MAKQDYRVLVHTPAELSAAYLKWARERRDNEGVTWGVPALDKNMIAAHPGDLCGIVGRPGSGKTSLLALLAINEAKRIVSRGSQGEQCVVYVTWESSSEELANFFLTGGEGQHSVTDVAKGLIPMEDVEREAIRLIQLPIFVLGKGIGRVGGNKIRMTSEVVYEAVSSIYEDFNVQPTVVCLDYLQIIPVKNLSERQAAVTAAPAILKELALTIAAPIFVGIQAARVVDTLAVKLPRKCDCQFSSSVEQAVDKLWGLWRPWDTEEPGTVIEMEDGQQYTVQKELLLIRKLKERFNEGRATVAMYFQPQYLRLAELELRNLNDAAPPLARPSSGQERDRGTGRWRNKYD